MKESGTELTSKVLGACAKLDGETRERQKRKTKKGDEPTHDLLSGSTCTHYYDRRNDDAGPPILSPDSAEDARSIK